MNRENSLYALAETDFTDRERFVDAAMLAPDHDPFKGLDALLFAFTDAHVHPNRVAGRKFGYFGAGGRLINLIEYIHVLIPFLNRPATAAVRHSAGRVAANQADYSMFFRMLFYD